MLNFAHQPAVIRAKDVHRPAQHLPDDVPEAKGLACSRGDGHGRRIDRRRVEIARTGAILRLWPIGPDPFKELGHRSDPGQEGDRKGDVECGVKIRDLALGRGLQRGKPLGDKAKQG